MKFKWIEAEWHNNIVSDRHILVRANDENKHYAEYWKISHPNQPVEWGYAYSTSPFPNEFHSWFFSTNEGITCNTEEEAKKSALQCFKKNSEKIEKRIQTLKTKIALLKDYQEALEDLSEE